MDQSETVEADLTKMTNSELDAVLKMRGIRGGSKLNKNGKLQRLGVEAIALGTTGRQSAPKGAPAVVPIEKAPPRAKSWHDFQKEERARNPGVKFNATQLSERYHAQKAGGGSLPRAP
jgi:hypothetical protein